MTVDGCGSLVVNADQSGYYRVLYNDAELTTLKSSFNKLATIDQLGLIADNFALAYADNQPIAKALDLLASVPQDAEPKLLDAVRSEEHTSELQSLMRISYAVFCLKKKKKQSRTTHTHDKKDN